MLFITSISNQLGYSTLRRGEITNFCSKNADIPPHMSETHFQQIMRQYQQTATNKTKLPFRNYGDPFTKQSRCDCGGSVVGKDTPPPADQNIRYRPDLESTGEKEEKTTRSTGGIAMRTNYRYGEDTRRVQN